MPKTHVEKSILIAASADRVKSIITDFNHWAHWSPWLILEPEAKVTVSANCKMQEWEGKRIVPAEWIEVSTYPWSIYNPQYGLARGMLWGVVLPREEGRSASFYHTGAGNHMLGVYPESGLVLVHRVDTENDFEYKRDDLYRMIELVFDAKIE